MANITAYLQAIMNAVYGEDVRSSIRDAIELINNVGEVVLTVGTAVTGPTSSSTGFYEDSLYINKNTWDLWKCTGTNAWNLEGNIKGETGNGIASIAKTGTSALTDTYTITFTNGTTFDFNVENGKGITSITGPVSAGKVDTYTINFNDDTSRTFTVTNGIDGNRTFHGTAISGKVINPTVFPSSGITNALENDSYWNKTEGAMYHCVSGGDASTATWIYDFTISGGGGVSQMSDLDDVDMASEAAGQILVTEADPTDPTKFVFKNKAVSSVTKQTYISSGAGSDDPISGKGVKDAISNMNINIGTPTDLQYLGYNGSTDEWENKSIGKEFVRFAGSINYADLITNASTFLTEDYEDAFFTLRTEGTIGSGEAALYWSSAYHDGDVIPVDSHIAVININRGTVNPAVYKYDDFGGFVDISGKLDKDLFNAANRRTPQDITSRIQADSGASLLNAIADQDLAKYGYSIGDYFESPTNRSLVTQTYSSGNVTTQTVSVKLRYYIADMDTWYGGYSSYEVVGTHHVSILVDSMVNRQWHSAVDITSVGYNLSALYTYTKGDILNAIKADMKALFGGSTGLEHLIEHQLYLTKAFAACEWTQTYIHTPSEVEIYGSNIFSGNDYQKYAFNKKLAIFDKYRFNQIYGNNAIWLCNMYSAASACIATSSGFAYHTSPVNTSRASGLILLH